MQSEPRTTHAADSARQNGDGHVAAGDEHDVPTDLPEVGRGAVVLIAVAVVVLFAGLFLLGWGPHRQKQADARAFAAEQADQKPIVDVVRPKVSDAGNELTLPGDVQALQATALHARTNGYIKALHADIGDRVKAGQLLAEIAAPEVDAELEQAKAALQQAQVTVGRATNEFNFNKATFDRYTGLSGTGGVTQQQLDERRSAFNIANSSLKAANANVAAAEAAVKRYTELQSFQRIVAPFDGTITARNYDLGALVSSTSAGRELFRVEQTGTLRVYINVPQGYVTTVKPGQEADLIVRNFAGKPFKGKVERTAGAIDPATRTLRVEVHFPNAEGLLFPGMYGQVRFKLKPEHPPLTVPTGALVFGPEGMRVAVVGAEDKVQFRRVTIGRDYGNEAEVAAGLSGEERVVTNPSDALADGVAVKVAATKKAGPPGGATTAGPGGGGGEKPPTTGGKQPQAGAR